MRETIQSRFAHAVTKDTVFEICKLLCTKSQLKTCFQLAFLQKVCGGKQHKMCYDESPCETKQKQIKR